MTSLATVHLPLSTLTDDQQRTAQRLVETLEDKQLGNLLRERYYAGKQRVRDLGIAIPPHLRMIETVVGWPGTVVDVLEERLDIDNWVVPGVDGDMGVGEIVEANKLQHEYGQGHLDAFIYGIAFVTVGSGNERDGEPHPLITVESPKWMTADWNRRKRRVDAALSVDWDETGQASAATLYVPRSTISLERRQGSWVVVDRDDHDLPRVPVERIVNRPRTGDQGGESEITPAVRAITDNAVRTVLGMEIAREFFSAPQMWLLGADESAFTDAAGNPKTGWELYIGRMKAISRDENGDLPEIKSFPGASPGPFLEQLRGLAQMMSAEGAMSPSYLGIIHDNPSSADAIRAGDVRTIKRAERRQTAFGWKWGEAKRLALWIRDGEDPGVTPRPVWKDAATPTRSAAADEAVKLVGSGILPPDSEVTQERVGLNSTDRARIADDRRRSRATGTLAALEAAAQAARSDPAVIALADAT